MALFNRKAAKPPTNNGPVGQGTRVASPVQGTLNGPKQPPTVTQFGGAESIGIEHTATQLRGWPYNEPQPIYAPSGNRTGAMATDSELQTGPAPQRVLRTLFQRVRGYIGPDLAASFPYNAEWSLIPHQFIPRRPYRVGPPARSIDDNAVVPPVYAGNPRR